MEHRLVCRNRISGAIQYGHWGSHIEAIQRWVKTVGQSRSNMEYWIEERAQGCDTTYLDGMRIIGLIGYKDSGKGEIADVLASEFGYQKVAFADNLKDVVSDLFMLDRKVLEGDRAGKYQDQSHEVTLARV